MKNVKLDLNSADFQKTLFQLSKDELAAVFRALNKISQMTWQQVYEDQGLKWEAIAQSTAAGNRIYSFRFSQKYRVTAFRQGEYMCLLGLHVDHDSAYH